MPTRGWVISINSAARALRSALIMLAGGITLASCAAPSSYFGIDLSVAPQGEGAATLQALARRAQGGDKRSQLELGKRFEEGAGVPADLEKAKALYTLAAKDTPITQTTFIPNNGAVEAQTVNAGFREGLVEAQIRLDILNINKLQPDGPTLLSDATIEERAIAGLRRKTSPLRYLDKKLVFAKITNSLEDSAYRYFLSSDDDHRINGFCADIDSAITVIFSGKMKKCYSKKLTLSFFEHDIGNKGTEYYSIDFIHSAFPQECDFDGNCYRSPFSVPGNGINSGSCSLFAVYYFVSSLGKAVGIIRYANPNEYDQISNALKREKIGFCERPT